MAAHLSRALALGALPLAALGGSALRLEAQDDGPRVRYVLSIGNHPRVDGIRLNYRDAELDLVRGANITIWTPYEGDWQGTVKGLARGLPSTGAARSSGIGVGVAGVAASEELTGIALGGIGVGAGGRVRGIAIGGIGVGAGDEVTGVLIGGIGVGGGGDVNGVALGGIGVGAGGNLHGAAAGLIGAGVGGDATGILIGGIGAAAGGSARALLIGGIGVGVGGDFTGIGIGGVGVGAGGTLHGLFLGGVGVGAPRIIGFPIGAMVGGEDISGFALAPVYLRITEGGRLAGASLSAFNRVEGDVEGFTVGLINYAWEVHGFQLGVINIIRDNPPGRRVLPLLNW
jgi:hypothetical protein